MKVFTHNIKISDIVKATGGSFFGNEDIEIKGIVTDSREIFEGALFVAIKGEKCDGADFIPSVIEKGAVCALAQSVPNGYEDKVILVPDSIKAIGITAAVHKDKINGLNVVAVTGSVGKTTTKEMIYAVLSEKYNTHKTTGNHNSDIGLPVSMLTLDQSYSAAVYEMGMSAKGEISYLTNIVRPRVAVITNIGSMHIEYLGSREAIRDAKMEIKEGLTEDGVLILNGDEPLLCGVDNAVYVSFDNFDSQYKISNVNEYENGSRFDIDCGGRIVEGLFVPALGRHNVFNAAMAYAVGKSFGMTDDEIKRGLLNFTSEDMRQNFSSHKDITVLMDCYNAGPESTAASLEVLKSYCARSGKRAVAVLGEMRELGQHADKLHFQTGQKAAECTELLFTVGKSTLAEGALSSAMAEDNVVVLGEREYDECARIIAEKILPGDCILFKASRSMKFEKLIDELKKIY